jgi:predicted lipoprotein with Yx(FWY)xxD motif
MRTNAASRIAAVVAILAIGALLAGCGGSDDEGSDSTTTTTAAGSSSDATTTTTAPAEDLTVVVKTNPDLGPILADPDGRTLYTLTDDAGEPVECTGACLGAWPALELPDGTTEPTAPEGVTLTVVDGPDGAKLVAADGLPLYTFAGDGSEADAKGEGLVSFGGTWRVVKATEAEPTPPPTSDDTTTTSSTY